MDGLKGRGQVIVIAATNLPDSIDPLSGGVAGLIVKSRSAFPTKREDWRFFRSIPGVCHSQMM